MSAFAPLMGDKRTSNAPNPGFPIYEYTALPGWASGTRDSHVRAPFDWALCLAEPAPLHSGTTCTAASILFEVVCWPMPGAGERRSLFLLARHGNRDMLAANDLVVGRIKSVPARARNVDFRPSMRGAVLTFAHLDVASDESC